MHELSDLPDPPNLLADLPLGGLRYYARIGSTNEAAIEWAAQGGPDLALVIADEQTAGRGRSGRRWFTPPGAGLAFSVILRPSFLPHMHSILRLTALGALAVSDGLRERYHLATQIKWPNDILAGGRKLAGVLVEAQWQGDELLAAILGIGINVAPASVPRAEDLLFPATCVEAALGKPVERWDLLHAVIQALFSWRLRLTSADFLQSWGERLAYRDEWVRISAERDVPGTPGGRGGVSPPNGESYTEGRLVGLNQDGFLKLRTSNGEIELVQFGDVHLRPMILT